MARQPSRLPWSRERLEHERSIALGAVLEASSHASYNSALQSYLTFCQAHHFPIDPTPDTLSFYIVYMCHHIKPKSVSSYLSGICNQLEPIYPEVRIHRKHRLVTNTLRGCTKLRAIPTTRKRPITREELVHITSQYPPSASHDDKLFIAILLTGFHGLMRLGELAWPDKLSLRDYRKVSRCNTVNISDNTFSFLLPSHKADHTFEGNQILLHSTNTGDDPLHAFTSYLTSRDTSFPLNPELWLCADGSIPTRNWFLRRLRTHLPDKDVAGHSLRAGGATALALAGIPGYLIQAIGRWASDTFRIYIRQHPTLLAAILYNARNAT
ncbi:hypothetical protein Hypma_003769 [Hypsizygus marmoreus]|uniref:Tyr recombinase domain-containing protein n=1 Tax=Hypsizygus marmoreus TaxID=39966 RepID=A0A369K422_HYPMA|nr:hypothetical protein Hypma_003769 [Hypsizygus marmoreus]